MEMDPPAPHNFEDRLATASTLLGISSNELVSIKARPITSINSYDTDYLSYGEYDYLNILFKDPMIELLKAEKDAKLYELEDGSLIVYIEHESGPELIFQDIAYIAGAVGGVAFAGNQIIILFNKLCNLLQRRSNASGRREMQPDIRDRDARGRFLPVSVEKRTKNARKLIRQIGGTAHSIEKAINSFDELADDLQVGYRDADDVHR